jgi:hypothetical protein
MFAHLHACNPHQEKSNSAKIIQFDIVQKKNLLTFLDGWIFPHKKYGWKTTLQLQGSKMFEKCSIIGSKWLVFDFKWSVHLLIYPPFINLMFDD